MLDAKAIGSRLREIRKIESLTVLEFEEQFHLTMTSWYRYENGRAIPSVEILNMFAEWYNIDLQWLLTGVGAEEGGLRKYA
jgi:transcriptional regulator with XRE-family HTH domain